jgi:hypothetical protein
MKVNKIVRYLVKDYGWSDTDKFTDMQLELIKDVADIVSNRLEQLVMPKTADKLEPYKRVLRVIYTWATFESGELLVPKHVEKLIDKLDLKPKQ